jgi:DNA-binding transcriptional ArsR family regulator
LSRSSDIRIIKDPEVAKLLADDTRRRILHMLRHKEMSPADLAKALDKNFSSVQHHLNQLLTAGLVKQTKEERVRNMVQHYYQATAHRFLISYSLTESLSKDDGYTQWHEDSLQKMYKGLEVFAIKVPEDKRTRVLELMDACVEMERKAFEEAVEKQTAAREARLRALREQRGSGTEVDPAVAVLDPALERLLAQYTDQYHDAQLEA